MRRGLECDRPKPNRNLRGGRGGTQQGQHQKTILNRKLQKSAILKTQTAQTVLETTLKHINFNCQQVSGKGLWILCPEKGAYSTVSEHWKSSEVETKWKSCEIFLCSGTQVMETLGLTVRYLQEAPLSLLTRLASTSPSPQLGRTFGVMASQQNLAMTGRG